MPESHEQRIERILTKLEEVRRRGLDCFGSDQHKFQLNPPIAEQELVRWETEQGVTLPADFRAFLRFAGNGGAGPYYGIDPLEKWSEHLDWLLEDVAGNPLALPCPLFPEMRRDEKWEDQFADGVSPYQGLISLGSQGCSYMMGLIITGEYRGRVVYLDGDGQAPYVVREPDFLSWYERWLDERLRGCDDFWFGYGIGGTEAELLAFLEAPDRSDSDRSEALYALQRLPKISEAGAEAVGRFIGHPAAEVRAAAGHTAQKFRLTAVEPQLPNLLQDPSPEVLQAAIRLAIALDADKYAPAIERLLHSEEPAVAKQAFFQLSEQKKLGRAVLLELVRTSSHGNLRYLAAHAINWRAKDEDLLVRLLGDEHPQVRFYAVLGLRQIGAKRSLDAVIELLGRETNEHTVESIGRMLGEVRGPRNADVLLEWAKSEDDFHRLTAVDSLCKLGDERVAPIAEQMLTEQRCPERRNLERLSFQSHVKPIGRLVRDSLRSSPNGKLLWLGWQPRWPSWMTFRKSDR